MTRLSPTRSSRGGELIRRVAIGALLTTPLGTMAVGLTWVPASRAAAATAATALPARTTWVQGDSVLLGALDQTRARLSASGWQATVNAFEGLSIPAATDQFRQHTVELGSVVVVELGNNFFGDPAVFAAELDSAMGAIQGRHVIWLTDAVFRPGQGAINDQIWAAASRWQNLEVADWGAVVAADPGLVYADGLHLTPPGYTTMAAFVLQHLNAWYGLYAGPSRPVVTSYGAATAWAGGNVINGVPTGMAVLRNGSGAWLVASDGGVFTMGTAPFLGSAGGGRLNAPVVGIAATADGGGYWLVAADGGVFTFGDARFLGSAGGGRLNAPMVGMAATADGGGYWLVAADGGVFTFGDARFLGSAGGGRLNAPVVGMAATADGGGYWLVAADGGVFTFGDARFLGSAGYLHLNRPVEGMALAPDGGGYWLVASDGGVFTFGDAPYLGSGVGMSSGGPAPPTTSSAGTNPLLFVGVAACPNGAGYWLLGVRAA